MALRRLIIILAIIAVVIGDYQHEVQTENKTKKALAAEKVHKSRSAYSGRERGSIQNLSSLLNRTEDRRLNRRRGKDNLKEIHQLNRKHKNHNDDMMNDNEGAIAISQKTLSDNDTDTLSEKMKVLRREWPTYEAVNKHNYVPQVTGVFCSFENKSESELDLCKWTWNMTSSSHGLGFRVVSPAELVDMNQTTRGMKFAGPTEDADANENGHFLYLPVDPTMENMVIKSPPFHGLWEFCKFEAIMHQSKMQNASIRLVSESTVSEVQWILQEVAGNNDETWRPFRFTVGKVLQEVRIIIEITRPNYVSLTQPLPHIAVDNIRMVECLPEPPVFNGQCQKGQIKCNITSKESCIKLQQVCDLVKDCDDGSDEHKNCDKMPYGSYCSFEQDSCGFEDIPQPILKWTRHNGPTPTDKTGPNFDHTCGPPDPYPTVIYPPLFPARMNFSLFQCVGYYYYVNMNVTGPNQEKADFASTAVVKTVVFNPPPKVHGQITSQYYNCCMIRFYYQQNGRNYGSLSVELVELTNRGNLTTSLWFSSKDKGENWYRAAIFLPNVTRRYYLQFKTRMGMRIYSDSAIDDFSMAPECFGLNIDPGELGDYNYYDPVFEEKTTPHAAFSDKVVYRFTTCGATGRYGPNQTLCDAVYNNTPMAVSVVAAPPYQGFQIWEVPAEGLYTIIAMGASGGLGSAWAGVSHGAQARALFELHKSEQIYMLVGQQGLNACKKTLSAQESHECARKHFNDSLNMYTSKTHEVRNTEVLDGGGGGGGATYVFLLDKEGQAYPLLVAGGGGGISVGIFRDDGSQHGKPHTNATPESGWMYGEPGRTSGAGGGWVSRPGPITPGFELVRGSSMKEGGVGGLACTGGAEGGFGGGGGGCLRGGGGGGWLGGNTNEGEGNHGGGGWSYIDGSRAVRDYGEVAVALRTGPGEVLIIPAIHECGCDYRCVALNEHRSAVQCYCPTAWSTDAHDHTKCVLEDAWPRITWVLVIAVSIGVFTCVLGVMCLCLYLYNSYQKKKEEEYRQKRLIEQEVQLHRLRDTPGTTDNVLAMAFNPHYGNQSMLPRGVDIRGLPHISRECLKLVKILGEGAFGEVYQGLYKLRPGDSTELPVAVKTLPCSSSDVSEADFHMEAVIMAKFNHPNVAQMIGVCFDKHPRFLVIELFCGGDLKNYLRESRPKPECASVLTMMDLLLCSIDVCKGCRHLEAKRFIHRDIAARNCLLTSRGPSRVVKVADFGMARDVYRQEYYRKGGKALLPIKWMPPEAYIDGLFTIKTDVWSFGVLLWEVFALGVMPYTGCSNREVMEMVSMGGRLERPFGCPVEIYRLMSDCWNPTPEARPSFAQMFDRLQRFIEDPEIVNTPLPVLRSLLPGELIYLSNGQQRAPSSDYLVPMSPQDNPPPTTSSMGHLVPHSRSLTAAQLQQELEDAEDLQFPRLLIASQEYGNIPMACRSDVDERHADASATSAVEMRATKFLQSNSTDRLLDDTSIDEYDTVSDMDLKSGIWETSFTKTQPKSNCIDSGHHSVNGPVVDKLISITPTSPKPPENALTTAIETTVIDKTNHIKNYLAPDRRGAPIASPDPPRINAWNNRDPPPLKPKPLLLDAAQLELNLNELKKNSGSVNLNTMNILPPYINVVTPSKRAESKMIQIDPKKAVIHDLQSPKDKENEIKEENGTLKQSNSAASLLNGPLTDVPYADSDNTSSSSGSNAQNLINNQKNMNNIDDIVVSNDRGKIIRQCSNGKDSEISC